MSSFLVKYNFYVFISKHQPLRQKLYKNFSLFSLKSQSCVFVFEYLMHLNLSCQTWRSLSYENHTESVYCVFIHTV